MSEFHFLRPGWLLMLIPLLLLMVMLWRRRGQATGWQAIIAPRLLPHLLLDQGHAMRRFPLVMLGLGWLLAVTALAGPAWERQPQPVYRAPIDRVMVLDMSPSMAAADLKPDRLTRARFSIQRLLAEGKEGRTALVVFGTEPHVVAPLTDDTATIEALLPALTTDILPAPGDRGGPALRMAEELLQRVGSTRGEVLLLSDGVSDPADTLEAIQDLRRRDVQTSVLGVGTLAGAPAPAIQGGFETAPDGGVRLARLDESGLGILAQAGGGRYQRLGQGPVTAILARLATQDPAQARTDRQGVERWVERGPWLLLPLILITAAGFRRGWLGVMALLILPPPTAQAFGWQDLWLRDDQQAARLLEQGEVAAAAERFENPQWRAMARYQAGDYASAAEGFAGGDADSHYNRGNALARAGRLQAALAAYDQALDQQPGHEDARFNRALVEKLLQSQQQPSSQDAAPDDENNDSGTGEAQPGNPDRQDREQQDMSAANGPQTGDSDGQAGAIPQPQDTAGADSQPTNSDPGVAPDDSEQMTPLDRSADPSSGKRDSADQARADVAPAENAKAPEQSSGAARNYQAQSRQLDTPTEKELSRDPVSERQLALEQWLRQVPDDPAGLLRRKFMLEHLLRQQGQRMP